MNEYHTSTNRDLLPPHEKQETCETLQKNGRQKFPLMITRQGNSSKYCCSQGTTKGKCHFTEVEIEDVLWENTRTE
jgi:hypothetical protein